MENLCSFVNKMEPASFPGKIPTVSPCLGCEHAHLDKLCEEPCVSCTRPRDYADSMAGGPISARRKIITWFDSPEIDLPEKDEDAGPKTKRCVDCGRVKQIKNFQPHPNTADGFTKICTSCRNRYKSQKPRKNAMVRVTFKAHPHLWDAIVEEAEETGASKALLIFECCRWVAASGRRLCDVPDDWAYQPGRLERIVDPEEGKHAMSCLVDMRSSLRMPTFRLLWDEADRRGCQVADVIIDCVAAVYLHGSRIRGDA